MTNLTEIILIILIVFIVFGMGKLPQVATSIGRLRSNFKKSLDGPETIDITPAKEEKTPSRKPGQFDSSVEDAHIDEA